MTEFQRKEKYSFKDLCDIVRILRSPGGCPWDIEQTHKSIRNDFIEEVYEAVEGIDNDDPAILREELGDVLLQVVFHSDICTTDGQFCIDDVITDLCSKLIIRHPHVFSADENYNNVDTSTPLLQPFCTFLRVFAVTGKFTFVQNVLNIHCLVTSDIRSVKRNMHINTPNFNSS